MEAYVLNISGREKGYLLQNKTFVPLDGPIFSLTNSSNNKTINFIHAAWNKFGTEIIAGDYYGCVYIFYLEKNRFSLICRLKTCSFLTFTNDKTQNVLVALSDCSIVSLKSESKEVINRFDHHTSCVNYISFNKNGDIALSCCKDQAILWYLSTFEVFRALTLKKDVDIIKVFFLPERDLIVSSFNDDSVFFWNFNSFKCTSHFLCTSGETLLNIKTVDASRDEKLLACAGKSNWFLIWSISENKILHTILLPDGISNVKQIHFLPNSKEDHILAVLSSDGMIHIFNIKTIELLSKITGKSGKIISSCNSTCVFQILAITLQGSLELFDVEEFLNNKKMESKQKQITSTKPTHENKKILVKKTIKEKKKAGVKMDKVRLQTVITNFGEYPEKYRFFVWSQILDLPHNVDAFKILHQESLKVNSFIKDYSFMNPGVHKTFLRLMAMLVCWNPLIQEIDYYQCVVFPFIKVLHKNTIMCFELLVTLISNWCQNWFLFCPFPPFNILCIVENILSFHDKELMAHFIRHDISPEVYAWSLLKTSFSEVFNKRQWLKLWDNILSNPLSFQLYAVAAFSVVMRDVILSCKTLKHFKDCYRRHGISASALLKKAYEMQQESLNDINPQELIGLYAPVTKGAYPSFFQMSQMKIDLQTLTRQRIIDHEIHYLKRREDLLDIKSNYLKELQELQILRRKLLLESIELKDTDAFESLDRKLKSIQNLIQDNLTNQVSMLRGVIGEDMFSTNKLNGEKQYFKFQDYMKRVRNN